MLKLIGARMRDMINYKKHSLHGETRGITYILYKYRMKIVIQLMDYYFTELQTVRKSTFKKHSQSYFVIRVIQGTT